MRKSTRRFTELSLPPDLLSSGLDEKNRPTVFQYKTFWRYIDQPVVASDEGWIDGHCPIHDPDSESPEPTAQFHFGFGVYRCLMGLGVESPCHEGKRSGTLQDIRRHANPVEEVEDQWTVELTDDEQAEIDAELASLEARLGSARRMR